MLQPPTGYWAPYSGNYIKLNGLQSDTKEVRSNDLVVPPVSKPMNLNKQGQEEEDRGVIIKQAAEHCPICKLLNWQRSTQPAKSVGNIHLLCTCVRSEGTTDSVWGIKMEQESKSTFCLDNFKAFKARAFLPESFMTFLHLLSPATHPLWNDVLDYTGSHKNT